MDPASQFPGWNRWCLRAAGGLLLAGLAMVFLLPSDWLFGWSGADLGQQFLAWRAFAAASLRAGHLPLWNPYTYSGEPFLAGFQAAVFYPPNLFFLVLPLCRAVNLSLLLHAFILGGGLFRWAGRRGFHPGAAALCGFILPLCGPVFPHFYAGHLSNLCTLAWAPWMFAGLERWQSRGERRGLLEAGAAVALQVLAGQMQYVFYLGVAALVHAGARALADPSARRRALPGLAAAYLLGAALAAAQLLPGLAAAGEGLRQQRLDPIVAGEFSLPPENLLTLAAPGFFGGSAGQLYWGGWFSWEMSLFLGVSGLLLLLVAAGDPAHRRETRLDLAAAALLLWLALGSHTPLFRLLYDFAPGFGRFRGWSKFSFPAALFLVLAIGRGADALLRLRRPPRAVALAGFALGGVGAAGGALLAAQPARIAPLLAHVRDEAESYLEAGVFTAPETIRAAGGAAGRSLATAGILALAGSAALALSRRRPRAGLALLALLPVEMLAFASTQSGHFHLADAAHPEIRAFLQAHPGDYRIQNLLAPNNGFLVGASDLWGDDPAVLRRYAEFMTYTQGGDPDHANQQLIFGRATPLAALLRLRFVFYAHPTDGLRVYESAAPLDRVQLVSDFQVLPGRNALLAALAAPGFDPRRTVLLEREPDPRPAPATDPGRVRVTASSADHFTVEADLAAPAILLVTDAYSRDWHARALPGSSQAAYDVLPADYVVRATPLAAGRHRIQFDYEPRGLAAGLWVSALAWAVWAALWLRNWPPGPSGPAPV
jgi:hypothetical protein